MSKTLNETALQSELSQGSAFFAPVSPDEQPQGKRPSPQASLDARMPAGSQSAVTPRHRDTTLSRSEDEELIETIRRAVNQFGKEDATYRFTGEEKRALAAIVYTYGVAGIRTSQNEIARIGINYLLEDYRASGAASVLARVLARLNE